jgi:sugar-specific transcriptional regulator TrmB
MSPRNSGSLAAVTASTAPAPPPALSAATLEALRRELEELGLGAYEARVLLALLRLGSASPGQLARQADVPRTSTYQVLEELAGKGLAERVPGGSPAVWTSRGPDAVLERLEALQEDRLREYRARSRHVRDRLHEALAQAPAPSLPYAQVIHDPSRVKPLYLEMLSSAQEEVLVFNRPPYSWDLGTPDPVIVRTAGLVRTRVLYQAVQVDDPNGEAWRQEMQAYHAAGVEARVVDELPMKLAIVDRRVALLTLEDPVLPNVGFPTSLLVEHPAFASVQADSFDLRWSTARPYPG